MNNLALIIMLIEYNNDKVEWHSVSDYDKNIRLSFHRNSKLPG